MNGRASKHIAVEHGVVDLVGPLVEIANFDRDECPPAALGIGRQGCARRLAE